MICPNCGRPPKASVENYRYTESGLDNVIIRNVIVHRCDCGEEYIQLPGIEEVHNQIARSLLKKKSLITGSEVKFLRKWLRLTSDQMAGFFSVNRVSVSRWENRGVNPTIDKAIRLFVAGMARMPLDPKAFFEQVASKSQKGFTIHIDPRSLPVTFKTRLADEGKRLTPQEFGEKVRAESTHRESYSEDLAKVA